MRQHKVTTPYLLLKKTIDNIALANSWFRYELKHWD